MKMDLNTDLKSIIVLRMTFVYLPSFYSTFYTLFLFVFPEVLHHGPPNFFLSHQPFPTLFSFLFYANTTRMPTAQLLPVWRQLASAAHNETCRECPWPFEPHPLLSRSPCRPFLLFSKPQHPPPATDPRGLSGASLPTRPDLAGLTPHKSQHSSLPLGNVLALLILWPLTPTPLKMRGSLRVVQGHGALMGTLKGGKAQLKCT